MTEEQFKALLTYIDMRIIAYVPGLRFEEGYTEEALAELRYQMLNAKPK